MGNLRIFIIIIGIATVVVGAGVLSYMVAKIAEIHRTRGLRAREIVIIIFVIMAAIGVFASLINGTPAQAPAP